MIEHFHDTRENIFVKLVWQTPWTCNLQHVSPGHAVCYPSPPRHFSFAPSVCLSLWVCISVSGSLIELVAHTANCNSNGVGKFASKPLPKIGIWRGIGMGAGAANGNGNGNRGGVGWSNPKWVL